jgi:hypothetical protein
MDPDLGLCTVTACGPPFFHQPDGGNLEPGPRLSPGWHPTLLYSTLSGRAESSAVSEVARWVETLPRLYQETTPLAPTCPVDTYPGPS